jgi:hypothetical protein
VKTLLLPQHFAIPIVLRPLTFHSRIFPSYHETLAHLHHRLQLRVGASLFRVRAQASLYVTSCSRVNRLLPSLQQHISISKKRRKGFANFDSAHLSSHTSFSTHISTTLLFAFTCAAEGPLYLSGNDPAPIASLRSTAQPEWSDTQSTLI